MDIDSDNKLAVTRREFIALTGAVALAASIPTETLGALAPQDAMADVPSAIGQPVLFLRNQDQWLPVCVLTSFALEMHRAHSMRPVGSTYLVANAVGDASVTVMVEGRLPQIWTPLFEVESGRGDIRRFRIEGEGHGFEFDAIVTNSLISLDQFDQHASAVMNVLGGVSVEQLTSA